MAAPLSAAEPSLPAFGEGAVQVRVYTDYFCGPCGAEEQEVMAAIAELVAKNRIRVIFIDTPLFPETVLYAGYFLAASMRSGSSARRSRPGPPFSKRRGCRSGGKASWRASWQRRACEIRPFDTAPVFALYSKYIKEDRINSTPTVVILGPQGKQILGNKEQILKALSDLRK